MGHEVLVANERELRGAMTLDLAAVEVVEKAFAALSEGGVVMPPILSMDLPAVNGEVDVKTAYIPGFDGFAIKVSPGFFDNPKLGLPSLNGLMMLFSAKTGLAQALFLDNGYLTDVRTAAAGAVAAKYLAPGTVRTAGVIGTGVQARLQIAAAHLVRPFGRVLVWGRNFEKARACATDIEKLIPVEAVAVEEAARAVGESELVVTTTPAREPVVRAEWLHPGMHVTAMGSDQEGKNELEPKALLDADLYVSDRTSQCELLGELQHAVRAGLWTKGPPSELGDVVTGKAKGRPSPGAVTICDLTGTGVQDTAIATHALEAVRAAGAGTTLES